MPHLLLRFPAVPGLKLTDTQAEQLKYYSDLLKPWKEWGTQDVVSGFLSAKPFTPGKEVEDDLTLRP